MNELNKNKIIKSIDFQEYLNKQLKNKEFKKLYDEYGKQLEIAYQIAKLRKEKRMSQIELAKQIGTTQSNVARMESGQQNFTISTLSKVAGIFNKDLKISIS